MSRFIRILQQDIVTNPEQWKDAGPGRFIKLPDRAKKVYCVLSVIAFSAAGNAEGRFLKNGVKLGTGWFWTSHAILQQLTGDGQKTVQRAIKELGDAGLIGYHPAKKNGHQCFFKIKRIDYNSNQEKVSDRHFSFKTMDHGKQELPSETASRKEDMKKKDVVPGNTIKLHIPYKEEGVLFQRGKDTHNAKGSAMNTKGKWAEDWDFQIAEHAMENEGEEAFLRSVAQYNLENHLIPKYREKFKELRDAQKLPVYVENEPAVPQLPESKLDYDRNF